MSNNLKVKIVKICVPNYIYPNNFDCLMKVFELMKKNNNDITYKNFKEYKAYRVISFDDDDDNEKNLKTQKMSNGIIMYYKTILAM